MTKQWTDPSRATRLTMTLTAVLAILILITGDTYAKETLAPEHIAKLRNVGAAVVSPDGKMVAYTLSVQRDPFHEDDGPAWSELHLAGADGVSRPFVTGKADVSDIKWMSDGKGISFRAKRGEEKETSLYVIPTDGGEARRIVTHGSGVGSYSWNPDGSKVAFLATAPRDKKEEELRKKGFNQEIYEEENRPVHVWIHDMTAPESTSSAFDLPGSASELHWSPDGANLAVALAPTPLIDDSYLLRRLHVIDASSGAIVTKIENPGKLGRVAWSPDGQTLAYISAADFNDPSAGQLMVASISDGTPRELLPDFEGHIGDIAWRDPQTVTYLANQGVWTFVDNVGLDSPSDIPIFANPQVEDINAAVQIGEPESDAVYGSISLSRDGRIMALVGESARHPREVYLRRKGKPEPVRLTDSNPWMADMRLAKQEVIRYAARDGLEIEALLIRPLDEKPGQRYPLIVQVHGGPESHYRNGWVTNYSGPGQMAAARGFAVVYPNYRASTGRGVEFSKLDHGDPAGKEFDDYVDAVDYLIDRGLVDKAKVGITGGSYGGYASAWGATYYSERFAASVMFVGLSDLVSKIGTTDIPNEMIEVHYRKNPWDDWQFFLERSPIYYVDKSVTPTLILHGKEDPRVNPGQSRELYRHLKMRGKAPVRLVLYPGEKHGNRRAASRYDYNLRMLRWMEHYLKGPGGDPPPYEMQYK